MERLEYQPRDYQLEQIEDLARTVTTDRPKILIIMGNPDRQGGGKSRMIDAMLANKAFDVEVMQLGDMPKLCQKPNWDIVVVDECRDFERVVVDSGHQLNGMFDFAPARVAPAQHAYGETGKRANTRSVGRSRAARAERWR